MGSTKQVVAIVLVLLGAAHALGQGVLLPAAGAPARPAGPASHGWFAAPGAAGKGGVIVHVPPRESAMSQSENTIRIATVVSVMPEAVAAWGDRVFVAFPPEGTEKSRRIMSAGVRRGSRPGTWEYVTIGGRLEPEPRLNVGGVLLGFVGTARGPMALLRSSAEGGVLRLVIAGSTSWTELSLPRELDALGSWRLVASWTGPMLVDRAGRGWQGRFGESSEPAGGVPGDPLLTWDALRPSELAAEPASEDFDADGAQPSGLWSSISSVRGTPIVTRRVADGAVDLWSLEPGAARLLRRITEIPSSATIAVVPLEEPGRVVLAWYTPGATDTLPTRGPARSGAPDVFTSTLMEVSASTGEILSQGRAAGVSPVSSHELRLIAFALAGASLAIVLLVLRPSGPAISLPRDFVLASPGRRVAAGLIDLFIMAGVSSAVTDVPFAQVLSIVAWVGDAGAFHAALLAMTFGVVYGTFWEWTLGATLGKVLTRCTVVQPVIERRESNELVPVVRRPTVWRALARNLVKWCLPPLAIAGASAPDRRHRGDHVAGTAVVMRIPESREPR